MSGSGITYCLKVGLHEYQADELTSHLNRCLSDWHTWMVRNIAHVYFNWKVLQEHVTVIDLICKKTSPFSSSVFLKIINKGKVCNLTLVSAKDQASTPTLSEAHPTHSNSVFLPVPLKCSALQEAAHDYLNTSPSLFLVIAEPPAWMTSVSTPW